LPTPLLLEAAQDVLRNLFDWLGEKWVPHPVVDRAAEGLMIFKSKAELYAAFPWKGKYGRLLDAIIDEIDLGQWPWIILEMDTIRPSNRAALQHMFNLMVATAPIVQSPDGRPHTLQDFVGFGRMASLDPYDKLSCDWCAIVNGVGEYLAALLRACFRRPDFDAAAFDLPGMPLRTTMRWQIRTFHHCPHTASALFAEEVSFEDADNTVTTLEALRAGCARSCPGEVQANEQSERIFELIRPILELCYFGEAQEQRWCPFRHASGVATALRLLPHQALDTRKQEELDRAMRILREDGRVSCRSCGPMLDAMLGEDADATSSSVAHEHGTGDIESISPKLRDYLELLLDAHARPPLPEQRTEPARRVDMLQHAVAASALRAPSARSDFVKSAPTWGVASAAAAGLALCFAQRSRSGRMRRARATRPSAAGRRAGPGLAELEAPAEAAELGARTQWPTRSDLLAAIPAECFDRDLGKSLGYLAMSTALTAVIAIAAYTYIPLTLWALPLWASYAVLCGTVATGLWVVAHECGHGAFSEHKVVNDTIGYVLHSVLLVPYFSWQRSHAVHHANTNHMQRGQTHVPKVAGEGTLREKLYNQLEETQFGLVNAFTHLVFGWPAYLLFGATSGPAYGVTSHIWPYKALEVDQLDLFPGNWKDKVLQSDVGIAIMVCLLLLWSSQAGPLVVMALYVGPYLVVNFWLVAITWLQHTHYDLDHYGDEDFSFVKGAFSTVDRNWGWFLDLLHHKITTTHVAHHVCERIPHYHGDRATAALRQAFPDLCHRDDTPFLEAMAHVSSRLALVEPVPGTVDTYRFPRRASTT